MQAPFQVRLVSTLSLHLRVWLGGGPVKINVQLYNIDFTYLIVTFGRGWNQPGSSDATICVPGAYRSQMCICLYGRFSLPPRSYSLLTQARIRPREAPACQRGRFIVSLRTPIEWRKASDRGIDCATSDRRPFRSRRESFDSDLPSYIRVYRRVGASKSPRL